MTTDILDEVAEAYSDCVPSKYFPEKRPRNLNFKATESIPVIAIADGETGYTLRSNLWKVLSQIGEYGRFNVSEVVTALIDHFPECDVLVCREYSVAIYVSNINNAGLKNVDALMKAFAHQTLADEMSHKDGEIRFWWD